MHNSVMIYTDKFTSVVMNENHLCTLCTGVYTHFHMVLKYFNSHHHGNWVFFPYY